jgi:hypothetical protein
MADIVILWIYFNLAGVTALLILTRGARSANRLSVRDIVIGVFRGNFWPIFIPTLLPKDKVGRIVNWSEHPVGERKT